MTESNRASFEVGHNDSIGNQCSATFNFLKPSSRRNSGLSENIGEPSSLSAPVILCGDILVIVRQLAVQTTVQIDTWQPLTGHNKYLDGSGRVSGVVAAYMTHTSFIDSELIRVNATDFAYYNLEKYQLKLRDMMPTKFSLDILVTDESLTKLTGNYDDEIFSGRGVHFSRVESFCESSSKYFSDKIVPIYRLCLNSF